MPFLVAEDGVPKLKSIAEANQDEQGHHPVPQPKERPIKTAQEMPK